nr:cytochrome c oxidase accessory protein CcoG [Gammaproteobacteria bacterium]
VIAALALFLFTALAGRLWCGYACPQTVFTQLFLWVERLTEGDRAARKRLDIGPVSKRKLSKKLLKHGIWLTVSAVTGFTFVGYFTPISELVSAAMHFQLGGWEGFWIGFFTFATYGNAGWMREQVCLYMCPYARFQGAMFDADTLIIAYDKLRGEPRGSRARGVDPNERGLGDCINCTMCVQVCPTGIDIRDGLQYECIACAACIDVCDHIMHTMGYPTNLIQYTTESEQSQPRKFVRPRILIYGAVLVGIVGTFLALLATRVPLDVDILKDRNALYRTSVGGTVENVYTVRVTNMDTETHRYDINVSADHALTLEVDNADVLVGSGEAVSYPVRIRADPSALVARATNVTFEIAAKDNRRIRRSAPARFLTWKTP